MSHQIPKKLAASRAPTPERDFNGVAQHREYKCQCHATVYPFSKIKKAQPVSATLGPACAFCSRCLPSIRDEVLYTKHEWLSVPAKPEPFVTQSTPTPNLVSHWFSGFSWHIPCRNYIGAGVQHILH